MRSVSASQGRLQADLQRLLGTLLSREISDVRLVGISITRLEYHSAARYIEVFVHRMSEEDASDCVARLNRMAPSLSHALRKALPKRRLPNLRFHWDEAFDKEGDMLKLLDSLKVQ